MTAVKEWIGILATGFMIYHAYNIQKKVETGQVILGTYGKEFKCSEVEK